jgi:hypothetical protein
MTVEEAYQILGIQPGATAEEVARAHRSLIKSSRPRTELRKYFFASIAKAEVKPGHCSRDNRPRKIALEQSRVIER